MPQRIARATSRVAVALLASATGHPLFAQSPPSPSAIAHVVDSLAADFIAMHGALVEKLAGRPWAQEIAERLAKPLRLSDTRNCATRDIIMRRAHGYESSRGGSFVNATYLAMSQPYAAGALCSTVGDLGRWNRALATGQVVSPQSYKLMTTPEGAAAAASMKYGFGLARDTLAGHVVITHGGGIPGFISANAYFPDADLSVTAPTPSFRLAMTCSVRASIRT